MSAVLKEPEIRTAYEGCPLCGYESEFLKKTQAEERFSCEMVWMKCTECSHVHTSHYFNDEGTTQLLSKVNAEGYFGGNLDKQRIIWGDVIERIIPHVRSDGRWIDVGVGNGSFLFTAAEFGFDAIGIDRRPYILDALKNLGYNVEYADAMKFDYSEASVVVLADILEHIPYPRNLLLRIREKLDGALFISCPNMDCVSWRYMDTLDGSMYWKELEHYHNFTRERLYKLLRECSFTPVSYSISPRYQACMEIIAV